MNSHIITAQTNTTTPCSKEEEFYPLTVKEIAKAQRLDRHFKATALKEKYEKTLIENTSVFCKNGKLVIPRSLQHRAVSWYHHYLQHPGNTHLEEHLELQCTGNKCVPLYDHMSKTVNHAR